MILADLTEFWESLSWGWAYNDTSDASISIKTVDNTGTKCRITEKPLWPGYDLLVIERDGINVWTGVITDATFTYENDGGATLDVDASDASWVLDRCVVSKDLSHTDTEASVVFTDYLDYAFRNGWILDMNYVVNPLGLLVTRQINGSDLKLIREGIRELADTGVDWCVVNDVWYIGGFTLAGAPVEAKHVFTVEDFLSGPQIRKSANELATSVWVRGNNGIQGNYAQYGPGGIVYETVKDEQDRIKDEASAIVSAHSTWDRVNLPLPYLEGDSVLSPHAPVNITDLMPGVQVRVAIEFDGELFDQILRVESLSVSASADGSEEVKMTLQPLGTASILAQGAADV